MRVCTIATSFEVGVVDEDGHHQLLHLSRDWTNLDVARRGIYALMGQLRQLDLDDEVD